MIHIAPSILAADFARLGDEVHAAVDAGGAASRIHIDVMDGHFVPNLSMGSEVVEALRPVTKKMLEVHLMIDDPVKYSPSFFRAGADSVIFHLEVLPDPTAFIDSVKKQGKTRPASQSSPTCRSPASSHGWRRSTPLCS